MGRIRGGHCLDPVPGGSPSDAGGSPRLTHRPRRTRVGAGVARGTEKGYARAGGTAPWL